MALRSSCRSTGTIADREPRAGVHQQRLEHPRPAPPPAPRAASSPYAVGGRVVLVAADRERDAGGGEGRRGGGAPTGGACGPGHGAILSGAHGEPLARGRGWHQQTGGHDHPVPRRIRLQPSRPVRDRHGRHRLRDRLDRVRRGGRGARRRGRRGRRARRCAGHAHLRGRPRAPVPDRSGPCRCRPAGRTVPRRRARAGWRPAPGSDRAARCTCTPGTRPAGPRAAPSPRPSWTARRTAGWSTCPASTATPRWSPRRWPPPRARATCPAGATPGW